MPTNAVADKPPKQGELPNMPKPKGAALKALEYLSYKEDLDSKQDALDKRSPETQKKYRFTVKQDEKLSVRAEPIGKAENGEDGLGE